MNASASPGDGSNRSDRRPGSSIGPLVDHLFRHESGRILAGLVKWMGFSHLDLAEEVVQEAMVKALKQWSYGPVPENPAAWLTKVAQRMALDRLRQDAARRKKQRELPTLAATPSDSTLPGPEGVLQDETLAMMF
jgi:RNA polymerase sigma-70 factor (ECF subfamily)